MASNTERIDRLEKELAELKGDKTSLVVVLDRSGSMGSIQSDMEGGLNSFIEDQKKVPGQCDFTLVQFDSEIETVHENVPLNSVPPLRLIPRNATALLDAMGLALTQARKSTARYKVAVIVTDGLENASRMWSREQIFALVTSMRAEGWQFTFLGANQDAIQTGMGLGMTRDSSMSFAASHVGTRNMARSMSHNTAAFRTGEAAAVAYSGSDRMASMLEDDE